jgi:hypothetical protein
MVLLLGFRFVLTIGLQPAPRPVMRYILLFILTVTLYSCRQPDKHWGFMAQSDCLVYDDEVISEPIAHGHVEYIDTLHESGCAKEQLRNVYLLYYDSICVAVYNQHPRENFSTIEHFIRTYQTDTTRLGDFARFDSSIRITIRRFCKDKEDEQHYGKFKEWREVKFAIRNNEFIKKEDELLVNDVHWTE